MRKAHNLLSGSVTGLILLVWILAIPTVGERIAAKERNRGEKNTDALALRLEPHAATSRSFVKFCDARSYVERPNLTTDMKAAVVKHLPVIIATRAKSSDNKVAEAVM